MLLSESTPVAVREGGFASLTSRELPRLHPGASGLGEMGEQAA